MLFRDFDILHPTCDNLSINFGSTLSGKRTWFVIQKNWNNSQKFLEAYGSGWECRTSLRTQIRIQDKFMVHYVHLESIRTGRELGTRLRTIMCILRVSELGWEFRTNLRICLREGSVHEEGVGDSMLC